jgi:flagellar hook-associated protein 3 FlgL
MMRISTSQFQQVSLKAILDQQAALSKTQQQLSTGKRILVPSDDPTASAQLVDINQSLKVYEQFTRNTDHLEMRLRMEEGALISIGNVLQRARELAVQGNNGTYSPEQLRGIAVEVRNLQEELLGLANTTDANNDFLFSGYQGQTKPFEQVGGGLGVAATFRYHGDQGQRQLQIGPERRVADSDSGYEVFAKVSDPTAPGAYISVFQALDELAVNLENDAMSGAEIAKIDASIEHLLEYRAKVGARLNTVDRQRTVNDDFLGLLTQSRSELEDLDFASAVSQMNLQMTGLNAAQQTFTKVQGLSLFNYL